MQVMAPPQLRVDIVSRDIPWLSHHPCPIASTIEPIGKCPTILAGRSHNLAHVDVFTTLSEIFLSQNRDSEFWWRSTGSVLAQMLRRAFYPLHQQYRYLVFFYMAILPELGPAPVHSASFPHSPGGSSKDSQVHWSKHSGLPTPPSSSCSPSSSEISLPEQIALPQLPTRFQSYMTDDHSPIELSWLFDNDGGAVVRFAIDPVKRQLEGDPRGAMGLFEDFARMKVLAPGVDLDWCRICAQTLTLTTVPATRTSAGVPEYPSQYFVGFDFSSLGIVMKAYFLPETRAVLTSTPRSQLVTSCITALSTPTPACPSPLDLLTPWKRVLSFFESLPKDIAPTLNIVAVDCVASQHNRVKIYARTPRATLANLRRFLTLGGDPSKASPSTQRALKQITLMWHLLFPELTSPECDDVEAPTTIPGHRTGGLLWYYELRGGHAEPFPKVYLPVRHWCTSDEQVVHVVSSFYRKVRNFSAAERYEQDVRETFNHRPLSARAGVHTYITFAVKQHDVEVTSYFNPECYAPERGTCSEANITHALHRLMNLDSRKLGMNARLLECDQTCEE